MMEYRVFQGREIVCDESAIRSELGKFFVGARDIDECGGY